MAACCWRSLRWYLFCFIMLLLEEGCWADRTRLKMYYNLDSTYFCFRRMNATHQIGCSSSRSGDVGIVHVVQSADDIRWITDRGSSPPYVAVLPITFFNKANLTVLKESGKVSGIAVLWQENDLPEQGYSPGGSCPNRNFGLYPNLPDYSGCKSVQWNPNNPALGMFYEDWNMPIFLLKDHKDIQRVKDCYEKFNRPVNGTPPPWPLCAMQLSSNMLAAKDTPTCMRRARMCDPLNDKNVIATLFPTNKSDVEVANRSVILVGARIDAFSQFNALAPGADEAVTGLVTLMTVAKLLSSIREDIAKSVTAKNKNVLFVIFNGEAFDYIGSSRVVYDMKLGEFPYKVLDDIEQPAPLQLHHVSHMIELSQVSALDSGRLWVHSDPVSTEDKTVYNEVQSLFRKLKEAASQRNMTFHMAPEKNSLPPASAQSFLKADAQIPVVVITDHELEYRNRYYNSIFDVADNINQSLTSHLSRLATAVATTIYRLLTDETKEDFVEDRELVENLLECYLVTSSCSLFKQVVMPGRSSPLTAQPFPSYVSVSMGYGTQNPITEYTHNVLANLTGEEVYVERDDCKNSGLIFTYLWFNGPDVNGTGVCVKSTVAFTKALSPAFALDEWSSREYSTWTESVWESTSIRIFLVPSRLHEGATLGIGLFVFLLLSSVVYVSNKKATVLFGMQNFGNSC